MTDPSEEQLAAALEYERKIADRAAEARGEAQELTRDLFLDLHELLCEPIPPAFIERIPKVEGKPYPSTGIRSVQVQVDRMNNVLTPLWWWDSVSYFEKGKLAQVTVFVGNDIDDVLTSRSSYGGVDRGSSTGNVYKGSYTNAAKLAFARLGPGHEVYVGAADLDPDVNLGAAENLGKGEEKEIGVEQAKDLVGRAWKVPAAKANLQRAASYAVGRDIGDCSDEQKAISTLSKVTFSQAEKISEWLERKEEAVGG